MQTNNLLELLGGAIDSDAISVLSKKVGVDNAKTKKAVAVALPELLWALSKNVQDTQWAESLSKALEKDHDGTALENILWTISGSQWLKADKIIEHILWGQSAEVVNRVSKATGIEASQSSEILKSLAPVLMGALGKAKKDGNLWISDISSILSQSSGASQVFVKFLDQDGDGDFDKNDMFSLAINYIKKNFLGK